MRKRIRAHVGAEIFALLKLPALLSLFAMSVWQKVQSVSRSFCSVDGAVSCLGGGMDQKIECYLMELSNFSQKLRQV